MRPSLALDPQRRRPLLMWQEHSQHPWLCSCRDRSVGRLFGSTERERGAQHPHSVASTVGAPSCCGCWTRDWRAPSLPQVGTITVLNCVMAGAPASASRTPHFRSSVALQSVPPWRATYPPEAFSDTDRDTDRVPSHTPGRDRRDDQHWRSPSRTFSQHVYDERAPRDAGGFPFALSTRRALDQGRRAPIAH